MDTKTYRLHPQFWIIFVFSTLPVGAALVTGLWLSHRIHESPRAETDTLRTEEVIAQDRLLVDALWSAIETIKAQALGLLKIRQAQKQTQPPFRSASALPEGMILHWAELEIRDGGLHGVRQVARNPSWNSGNFGANPSSGDGFESFYLQSAITHLNLKELQENGVALLRIKQDPHRNQEWLALGFLGTTPSSVVLALVDPVEIFPIFRRWTQRSEGGNLRGYLIGSDGHVLIHSQKPYVSSDFSGTQVFKEGVREMLRGHQVSGAGVFRGIDELPVTVAYARPGSLPIGAVVERVSAAAVPSSILASAPLAIAHSPLEVLEALGALLFICLGCTFSVRAMLTRNAGAAHGENAILETVEPVGSVDDLDSENAFLSIEEVWESDPLAKSPEDKLEDRNEKHALFQSAQSARADKILLAKFETEAVKAPDSGHVASQLAETAARFAGSPALFFGYHEKLRSAIIQSHAGLKDGAVAAGLAFALSEPMLERIARYTAEGKTASISDHPALALLLAKRFGSPRCEAWPVSGAQGKLLGFLVVLNPMEGAAFSIDRSTKLQSLEKIVKASGPLYEDFSQAYTSSGLGQGSGQGNQDA